MSISQKHPLMNKLMTQQESQPFRKALKTFSVAFLYTVLGVCISPYVLKAPEPVKTIVYKEATDEQLMAYWFGPMDKSQLRKRVCK